MALITSMPGFRLSARRDWPWATGCLLLVFACAVGIGDIPGLRQQKSTLEGQVRSLQEQMSALNTAAANPTSQDFQLRLATLDRLAVVTSDLHALASENGLDLADASYSPVADSAATPIGRVDINTRLKGRYPALKKALASLLGLHEGLALQSVSLSRNRSTDTALAIDLRFTYFYRREHP